MGEMKGAYRACVGKPDSKSHMDDPDIDGRIIFRWIQEVGFGDVDWIDLAQDRWRHL